MRVGSLFSGIGGIELGLERAGVGSPVWFVENNLYCQEVLKTHWKGVPVYDDIRTIDWSTVERPDVLTGGFPCQDISVAGKRVGITGARSGLWKEYFRAIRSLRPKYAVIENVRALLERGMGVVLSDLSSIRYDAEWRIISAASVGAPHLRERVFILAYPNRNGTVEQRRRSDDEERNSAQEVQESRNEQFGINGASSVSRNDADSCFAGLERNESKTRHASRLCEQVPNPNKARLRQLEFLRQAHHKNREEIWKTEPGMGRLVDGISSRMDNYIWREQISALGNAVVSQCAEVVGELIKKREGMK